MRMEVQFIFLGRDNGHAYLGGNLLLYGRVSKPSTMIALPARAIPCESGEESR